MSNEVHSKSVLLCRKFFQREDIVCIPVEMKEILEVGILTVYQVKKIIKFKKKKRNTYRGG